MNNIDWQQVFISIFVGAVISFLTVFLEGLLDFLYGLENNVTGGVVGSLWYIIRHA